MILPIGIIRIGKITLSAKGITDEITDNHPIDICSATCPDKRHFLICLNCFEKIDQLQKPRNS